MAVAAELLSPIDPDVAAEVRSAREAAAADLDPAPALRYGGAVTHRMVGYLGPVAGRPWRRGSARATLTAATSQTLSGGDMKLDGLHHITMITGDAQRNVDFYADLLGLRLVKTTVNFDAPEAYHLYFGDEIGQPGLDPHVVRIRRRGPRPRGRRA